MLSVQKISKDDWARCSASAHLSAFDAHRPASFDRVDYTLLAVKDDKPIAFATVHELDAEHVYWQHGGAFPIGFKSLTTYRALIEAQRDLGTKVIHTFVHNQNVPYLKIAMKCGFRVIGTSNRNGKIVVELMLEL